MSKMLTSYISCLAANLAQKKVNPKQITSCLFSYGTDFWA